MARQDPIVIDFESEAIEDRPRYPPRPVGVAILEPGKKPCYLAWGHPTKNNATKAQARERLKGCYRSGRPLLFHNAKFDLDVAETHLGLKPPSWDLIHDTMFLLFLRDPHAMSLSLKPAAARLLNMPPEERDAVNDWLVEHGVVRKNQKDAGAYICKAPGDVVGRYAVGDVVRTKKLFDAMLPYVDENGMLGAYNRERRLLPLLLANERTGMRVDVPALCKDIATYERALTRADAWLRKRLKAPGLNVDSDEEVADRLDAMRIVTDWVLTPKSHQRSLAKGNLTPEMFKDKRVARVLGYRNRLTTVLSMSMRPWLEVAETSDGRIYTQWNQVRQSHGNDGKKGARTGRLSCSRFMNITKDFLDRDDGYEHPTHLDLPQLPLVRKYILPEKGEVLAHRDYNQQELRILAHFEDGQLCEAYKSNPRLDVHDYVRGLIKEILGLDLPRRPVKIINFGKVYGMGLKGIIQKLKCSLDEAKQLTNAHGKALPGVQALDRDIKMRANEGNPIRTWGGRIYYKEPAKLINGRMVDFGYKLLNYLIQGSAADCTKEAVIRYHEAKKHSSFKLTVHDELNVSVPKKALKEEMKIIKDVMASVEFDVPMLSDGKVGPNWGSLKAYKD